MRPVRNRQAHDTINNMEGEAETRTAACNSTLTHCETVQDNPAAPDVALLRRVHRTCRHTKREEPTVTERHDCTIARLHYRDDDDDDDDHVDKSRRRLLVQNKTSEAVAYRILPAALPLISGA